MFRNLSLVIAILLVISAPSNGADTDPSPVGLGCSSSDAFGTESWTEGPGSKYIAAIEKRIRKHWHPEGGENARPAVVTFSLGRNGEISQVRLKRSSQTPSLDKAALAAVRQSNPLPAIPSGLLNRYSIELTLSTDAPGVSIISSAMPGVSAEIAVPTLWETKIDWPAYVRRLGKVVARKWHSDQSHNAAYTTLQFKIFRNGSIADLKVQGQSGSKRLTENALKAMKLASPFPPLPKHAPRAVFCYLDFNECPEPPRFAKSPSVTAQPDVDFGPYMADLQRKIKAKVTWPPLRGNKTEHASVVFKVHQDGHISDLRLEKTSENEALDAIAISAIEHAAPFGQLPKGASDDVDIQYTFENMGDPAKHPKLSISLSMPYQYFTSAD